MAAAADVGSSDEAVQATNDDATICKRHAVEKGYWEDGYVQFFCKTNERRSPEINRGYYARVMSIRNLIIKFLTMLSCDCQVISMGAGFDSTYWVLREMGHTPKLYVEVDFGDVTVRKCHYIKTKQKLLNPLLQDGEVKIDTDEVCSQRYHLVSCNLRDIECLDRKLKDKGIIYSLPTFFITECVLVYMEPSHSKQLIQWAGSNFKSAVFVNYEPIHPNDRFGITMKRNLSARGCALLGIEACPDLPSQKSRFIDSGWSSAWAMDMLEVYKSFPNSEISRIEKINLLDEKELLEQLLQHYTLSCGINDSNNQGLEKLVIHTAT